MYLFISKRTIVFIIVVIAAILILNASMLVKAEETGHLVLSEIKVTGGSGKSTDEFVEIYNPTEQDINLAGWQLIKKTAAGSEYILVNDFGETEVKAHSFFLITHPLGYLGEVPPDFYYTESNSIASNNTVILADHLGNIIDKAGFGSAADFEGEPLADVGTNKSIERKARTDSTGETMVEGGVDYFLGNSWDSDNNLQDFIIRAIPEPQNSQSEIEYLDIAVPEIVKPPAEEDTIEQENEPALYSDNIIISELFPNPAGVDDQEFIELQNIGTAPVDLAGWQVGDNSTRRYTVKADDFSSTVIEAGGYFVINKEVSGISLNNTSDFAKLYYPDENLAEAVEYSVCQEEQSYSLVDGQWSWTDAITSGTANKFLINNEWPIAQFELEETSLKVGQTLLFDASESSDPDGDELEFFWDFGNGESATEEKAEFVYEQAGIYSVALLVRDTKDGEDEMELELEVTDYDYSDKILINELLPACTESDADCEFIELYNLDSREINLEGWQLTDLKSYYKFPEASLIKAGAYLIIKRVQSKITLNNSGDLIYLLDPRGNIVNGVEYSKAQKDVSFSRNGDKWLWTDQPTPGEENVFFDEEYPSPSSGSSSGDEAEDSEVELEKINLVPIEIAIADINEQLLGELVKVTGEVESAKSTGIYLMDEQGYLLRVYLQKKANIPQPVVEAGDIMTVTGILDKTSAGFRLLPRAPEDIVVTKKIAAGSQPEGKVLGASAEAEVIDLPENDKSGQVKMYLLITAGVAMVGLGGWLGKLYLSKRAGIKEETIDDE